MAERERERERDTREREREKRDFLPVFALSVFQSHMVFFVVFIFLLLNFVA